MGEDLAWRPVAESSPITCTKPACSHIWKSSASVVGYGCTTCIGNSGPLPDAVIGAVKDDDLVVAAVSRGNRNFEGRINPHVRANYLASPPLVVAYALAGTMDVDLTRNQ